MYETWCETCEQRDRAAEIAKGNTGDNIPLYKYIGETSRSAFERGLEHSNDCRLFSTSSHFLKHYLDRHTDDEIESVKMRMRMMKQQRSAYQRQIHESVAIQKLQRAPHSQ